MSTSKITDEGVASLDLAEGRAELLEEIMATTPLDDTRRRTDDPAPAHGRWLPVLGAAAAVAVIAGGAVWVADQRGEEPRTREVPVATAPGQGEIAVLPVDGWDLAYATVDTEHGGELSYEASDPELDVTPGNDWGVTLDIYWRPAAAYEDYYEDRQDIGRGEPAEVLGVPATMWHYSKDDHTVIREVVGDFTLEVRGSGMGESAFVALLDRLEPVAADDLDAHLPEELVTDAERPGVVADMLDPIPLPDGFDPETIESQEVTRYQLGADVTSAVTCAWVDQYVAAGKAGDDAALREAQQAMATARDWPILREMRPQGGWSPVLWDIADRIVAGRPAGEVSQGIGCEG